MYRANSTAAKSLTLRIIYNLRFEESNFWFDIYSFISLLLFIKNNNWRPTCFIVQTTGFNRPAKFLILLKHWGYDNLQLVKLISGLSKSPALSFPQVSADSFRVNIQECSRSLYAFIAFRPTCFAQRLVMRNLHETSTQRARWLYPDSKNNSRRITCGIGYVWGMPSLSPLSSLGITYVDVSNFRLLFFCFLSLLVCFCIFCISMSSLQIKKFKKMLGVVG